MFETLNRSQQGMLGEARAIYELTRLGYQISRPLDTHIPYDLIADKDGILYKVQVKTSRLRHRSNTPAYSVQLATTGGNTVINTIKHFDSSSCDLLFVLTSDDRCWIIPTAEVLAKNNLIVGTDRYKTFQVSGPVIQSFAETRKEIVKSKRDNKIDKRVVAPPFTRDQLTELIAIHPMVVIAKRFNMSDNGVSRWAKKWNIPLRPRGYWQKKRAEKET